MENTPGGMESSADALSGSAVVAYMDMTKDLRVLANDRLSYWHHASRAIIEYDNSRLGDEEIEALLAEKAKANAGP